MSITWSEGNLILSRLQAYIQLIRLDKPVGILLLLWPTLWALFLASDGWPKLDILVIFVLGTVLMRSAGCAVNDFADRDFDRHVERTRERPLTSGKVGTREALLLAAGLALAAFILIQPLNLLTKSLSVWALLIAIVYPFTKRFFVIPQAVLGIAFGFGIPMAFAAVQQQVPLEAWILLLGNIFWAIAYDTAYARVDREDDLHLGLHTSAITFGRFEVKAIGFSYAVLLITQLWVAYLAQLSIYFYLGWLAAFACAIYELRLVSSRDRNKCFAAFRHNNWLGACLFLGIVAGLLA